MVRKACFGYNSVLNSDILLEGLCMLQNCIEFSQNGKECSEQILYLCMQWLMRYKDRKYFMIKYQIRKCVRGRDTFRVP